MHYYYLEFVSIDFIEIVGAIRLITGTRRVGGGNVCYLTNPCHRL